MAAGRGGRRRMAGAPWRWPGRCRLEADEPEEALRLGKETLFAVPREHRSEIMVRAARSLGDSVAGRHGDFLAVREYREALATA